MPSNGRSAWNGSCGSTTHGGLPSRTDHPNGGSFLAYPEIIALLMDRGLRAEVLARLPERVRARSGLGELSREYSLSDIAIITRAAPRGCWGSLARATSVPGPTATSPIYAPDDDRRRMFALPRYVIKAGTIVVDDGELRAAPDGRHAPGGAGGRPGMRSELDERLLREASIHPVNYRVGKAEVHRPVVIGTPATERSDTRRDTEGA